MSHCSLVLNTAAMMATGVILLCSCSHGAKISEAVQTPSAFQFKVPIPVTFTVDEVATRDGKAAHFKHTARLDVHSNNLVMRFTDSDLLLPPGSQISAEEQTGKKRLARLGMLATPPAIISRSGKLTSCLNVSRAAEQFDDAWKSASPERSASEPSARDFLKSHEGLNLMAEFIRSTYWAPWFEYWIDWDLQPGEHRKTEARIPLNSSMVNGQITKANWGDMSQNSPLVHLEITTVARGPDVLRALRDELEKLVAKAQQTNEPRAFPEIVDAYYSETVHVETDPKTLMPAWAERIVTITFMPASHNEQAVRTVEARKFTFNWNKQ